MSLLLDALKRAELAKQRAQASDNDTTLPVNKKPDGSAPDAPMGNSQGPASLDMGLTSSVASESTLGSGPRAQEATQPPVLTKDRLPRVDQPLEIVAEPVSRRTGAPPLALSLEETVPPPSTPRGGMAAPTVVAERGSATAATVDRADKPWESVPEDRETARQIFEVKQMNYNPRRPFYMTLAALAVVTVGTVIYFWMEMQPRSNFVVASGARPAAPAPAATPAVVPRPTPSVAAASAGSPSTAPPAQIASASPMSPASSLSPQGSPVPLSPRTLRGSATAPLEGTPAIPVQPTQGVVNPLTPLSPSPAATASVPAATAVSTAAPATPVAADVPAAAPALSSRATATAPSPLTPSIPPAARAAAPATLPSEVALPPSPSVARPTPGTAAASPTEALAAPTAAPSVAAQGATLMPPPTPPALARSARVPPRGNEPNAAAVRPAPASAAPTAAPTAQTAAPAALTAAPAALTAAPAAPSAVPAAPSGIPTPSTRRPREIARVADSTTPQPPVRPSVPDSARMAPQERPSPPDSATGEPATQRIQVTKSEQRVDPNIEAAYAAFTSGNLQAARQAYQRALEVDPLNRDALLGLAAIDIRMRDYQSAASRYQQLLELKPRDPVAQAGLMGLQMNTDPVEAESRIKTLLAQQPNSPVLLFSLGNQYAAQARWLEAQAAYFKAYSADPQNPDFAFNLAVSLDQLRQSKAALDYYQKAIALAVSHQAGFDRDQALSRIRELSQ